MKSSPVCVREFSRKGPLYISAVIETQFFQKKGEWELQLITWPNMCLDVSNVSIPNMKMCIHFGKFLCKKESNILTHLYFLLNTCLVWFYFHFTFIHQDILTNYIVQTLRHFLAPKRISMHCRLQKCIVSNMFGVQNRVCVQTTRAGKTCVCWRWKHYLFRVGVCPLFFVKSLIHIPPVSIF